MRIIPSILTNDIESFTNQILAIEEFTDEVDIDVMDGTMTANRTVDISNIREGSPLIYNFDLMIKQPEPVVQRILEIQQSKNIKVGRIFVHYEADFDLAKFVETSKNHFEPGISVMIETASENFLDMYKKFQKISPNGKLALQLYTVQIGGQGNPYHPEVLSKISQVRAGGFMGDIYIDGGIDPDIVFSIRNLDIAGVSVGSYISHNSDPMKAFNTLRGALWKKRID